MATTPFVACAVIIALAADPLHARESASDYSDAVTNQPDLVSPDPYTLTGTRDFLTGYGPVNADASINVVIEIPSGTNAKWEVAKPDGVIRWTFKNDRPRVIDYLSYPGNYGMIPGTLLTKESGGDGDPLDVLVIGPAIARGSVISARVIGVLHLLDAGEKDDKLIAVMPGTALYSMGDIEELDSSYEGILDIIELWFSNYKGPGKMRSLGYGDKAAAGELLHAAIRDFNDDRGM